MDIYILYIMNLYIYSKRNREMENLLIFINFINNVYIRHNYTFF